MDSLVLPWVNAQTMSLFLAEVAQRHADEFVLMVMDQAGWHLAGELVVPLNMRLLFLPPYSPTTCDGYQYQERNQSDTSIEVRLTSPGALRSRALVDSKSWTNSVV